MSQTILHIRIQRLPGNGDDIPLPSYATDGSSGMDLHAAVAGSITLDPGSTALIPTGFCVEIPRGFEGQVRPRSGLAIKHGIGILNSPGTLDADYRGEIKVILSNFSSEKFVVQRGDRIAQLIVSPVVRAVWDEVSELDDTKRGSGGFGHTGR